MLGEICMNRLLLFLFGTISFKAEGGFAERFLNLCTVRGVKLINLTSENGVLYAETSLSGFRKIRVCASRSGMKVKIVQKKGLPFVYARFAGRTGLFAGIAVCCFLLFFYTRSVWFIEIKGNEKISSQKILQVLETNGIKEGTLKKEIDNDTLSLAIYEAIPDISWLNLGIDGSRLTVDIREVVEKPQSRDSADFCNIIASKGGVIDKMRVYEGEALVQEGDGVSAGQLLVSGVIFHEEAKLNTFHRSKAEIYAFTNSKNQIKVSKNFEKTEYTGRSKRYKVLRLFRLQIPLYLFTFSYEQKEVSVIEKPLVIASKKLPVGIFEVEAKETKTKKQTLNQSAAEALARAEKKEYESGFSSSVKILDVKKSVKEQKDCFVFTYSYKLYEDIASESIIEIDDKNINNTVENGA